MVGACTSLSTLGERLPFHPPATTCLRYPAPTYTSGCAALRRSARLGLEHQAGAVHAEALALGGRAVVEHMAEVGVALGAADLGAHQAGAGVGQAPNRAGDRGLREAGPAAAGDRKDVVEGRRGAVRVDLGGHRFIKKKKNTQE